MVVLNARDSKMNMTKELPLFKKSQPNRGDLSTQVIVIHFKYLGIALT